MTGLQSLLTDLNSVVRQRLRVRRLEWLARAAGLIVGLLIAAALADYLWGLNLAARWAVLFLVLPTVGYAAWRLLRPQPIGVERPIQLARAAARHPRFVGDVLAAIEFQQAELRGVDKYSSKDSWQLKQALIDDVAGRLDQLDLDRQRLRLSAGGWTAGIAVLAACLVALLWWPHAITFAGRVIGLPINYPTRTRIERLAVDGRESVMRWHQPQGAWAVRGEPTSWSVECVGDVPDEVTVELRQDGTEPVPVVLAPRPRGADDGTGAVFTGSLPPLRQAAEFHVLAGDAQTRWARLDVRDRPLVTPRFVIHPPAYARREARESSDSQLRVLPGSTVETWLASDQPLSHVATTFEAASSGREVLFESVDDHHRSWRFPANTEPLDRILDPQRFSIDVESLDGVGLAMPLHVEIALQRDEAPRVVMQSECLTVVPGAQPVIRYQARDDFGIQEVSLVVEVLRDGKIVPKPSLVLFDRGESTAQPTVDGEFTWDLSEVDLQVGDRLRCTPWAGDFREPLPSQSASGESFELRVAEPADVMADVARGDEESLRRLDEVIRLYWNAARSQPGAEPGAEPGANAGANADEPPSADAATSANAEESLR